MCPVLVDQNIDPQWGLGCRISIQRFNGEVIVVFDHLVNAYYYCPVGAGRNSAIGCIGSDFQNGSSCAVGNPIDPSTGGKKQIEEDFSLSNSSFPISIRRVYSSRIYNMHHSWGLGWNLDVYSDRIKILPYPYKAFFYTGSESKYEMDRDQNGNYQSKNGRLRLISEGENWVLYGGKHERQIFNPDGRLNQVSDHGLSHYLYYSDTVVNEGAANSPNQLQEVRDNFGNAVSFIYSNQGIVSEIHYNGERVVQYFYKDAQVGQTKILQEVVFRDESSKSYHYTHTPAVEELLAGLPTSFSNSAAVTAVGLKYGGRLTGLSVPLHGSMQYGLVGSNRRNAYLLERIIDQNGNTYAEWEYDGEGRAVSSKHAGGADYTQLEFSAGNLVTVTNSLGKKTTYEFAEKGQSKRVVKK